MSWLFPSLPTIPGWSRSSSSSSSSTHARPSATQVSPIDDPDPDSNRHISPFKVPSARLPNPGPIPLRQQPMAPPVLIVAPPSPPSPATDMKDPPSELNIAILSSPVPLGNMPPPPSTTLRPTFGIQPGGSGGGGGGDTILPVGKGKKGKVPLEPGHSALDWARLTSSGTNLRGTDSFPLRITLDQLKIHNTRKDAWSAFNGKVYNITRYLRYHPGGEHQMMRAAGRDGTKLFMVTHSWVNVDYMLQECMVGVLVRG
ncbi:MAG: hypothetical protein TREMPRED_005409 [Tremellales sp. Tagirdzhanova-0007]|nr:MAG: hypothetical protein TREMPRED_005409 [Tremellales sp. Tagirdzhanova-0007]